MAVHTKKQTSIPQVDLYRESYDKMQRWYRIQRFARDVHRTLRSDEEVDLFIQHGRHELAAMIPPRGDVD